MDRVRDAGAQGAPAEDDPVRATRAYSRTHRLRCPSGEIAREVGARSSSRTSPTSRAWSSAGVHPDRRRGTAPAITTTTHKTLRGPRGGLILCKQDHAKAIDRAVFPGLQGGPHNHTTAAKAVAFKEASTDAFKTYAAQIVANGSALAEGMVSRGMSLITGGTDNHLVLVDVTKQGISGRKAARALNRCGIELNANSIPFDPRKPFDPSGLRVGVASLTSRGMKAGEMDKVADFINRAVVEAAGKDGQPDDDFCRRMADEIREFVAPFPAPGL